MRKLNPLVIAAALLFAAGAQADNRDAAAQASQEQTAQAMRAEGVDHLIPAPRSERPAASARTRVTPPAAKPSEASPSRAEVIAELQRARQSGELAHHITELGHVPAPVGRVSNETRLAALQASKAR